MKSEEVLNKIKNIPEQSIVVLDDLMAEMVKSEDISNVLTRESHHKGWCVILLWQDMFPTQQFARTIALQCDYKYIYLVVVVGDEEEKIFQNHHLQIIL